jgi:hypothetical protein
VREFPNLTQEEPGEAPVQPHELNAFFLFLTLTCSLAQTETERTERTSQQKKEIKLRLNLAVQVAIRAGAFPDGKAARVSRAYQRVGSIRFLAFDLWTMNAHNAGRV